MSDISEELMSKDNLSVDIISKFHEILAKETDFRPLGVIWDMEKVTPVDSKHIQIMPCIGDSEETHWICVYYDGAAVVHVYDSANPERTNNLTLAQYNFLYKLFPNQPEIRYEKSQQQTHSVDCGVFAIAYAVTIALGYDPSEHRFKIGAMRSHLKDIFERKKMIMFPVIPKALKRKARLRLTAAERKRIQRANESEEKRKLRQQKQREHVRKVRETEKTEDRVKRLKRQREYAKKVREAGETEENRAKRLKRSREYIKRVRENGETEEKRKLRLEKQRQYAKEVREGKKGDKSGHEVRKVNLSKTVRSKKELKQRRIAAKDKAVFNVEAEDSDTSSDESLGSVLALCKYCLALKWKGDQPCCDGEPQRGGFITPDNQAEQQTEKLK